MKSWITTFVKTIPSKTGESITIIDTQPVTNLIALISGSIFQIVSALGAAVRSIKSPVATEKAK